MLEATRHEHREAVAFHKAGHAVMRWLQGCPLGPVCIHPDGTGRCETPTPDRRMRREDAVCIALAGPCAEVGALTEINLEASHSSDLDSARQLLTPDYVQASFYPPLSQEEALRHYYNRVRDCLGREALLVEAVAEALLDAASLSAEALREVLVAAEEDS
jgi:hypothetical protein